MPTIYIIYACVSLLISMGVATGNENQIVGGIGWLIITFVIHMIVKAVKAKKS